MDPQDPNKPPEPELELARPARPSAPPPPRPSVSNPNLQAVRSAQRAQPLAGERGPTSARLKEGAADTLLNSLSILGEVVEDFKNSDKFFKYKAGVLSLWFLLMIGAFGIACPSTGPSNDLSAALVATGEAGRQIYMVKNEGTEPWQDVEIVVNGEYRATMTTIEPEGGNVTLSSAILFDEKGKRAPSPLQITEIEVRVREPEGAAVLLHNGAQPK
ncbi:MAG: hypothetical protein U0228_11730 [Myxococcaceae bacterium]